MPSASRSSPPPGTPTRREFENRAGNGVCVSAVRPSTYETHYLAQGASIYNWTASYHDRGDGLYVDGRLRANGNTVSVHCSAARGAHERDLVMRIDETGG